MLTFKLIVGAVALALVAARPRSSLSAVGAMGCAGLELAVGAVGFGALWSALVSVGPAVAFLWAVMTLALLAERSGLATRLATALMTAGRGSSLRLFCWVCGVCALLTAALSLDGAVVVMAPVLLALRRHGAPHRPLLLGTVAVANAFSAALPAGNPTNLVVMERLGLSPGAFVLRMGAPSLVATLVCVAAVAALERPALATPYPRADPSALRLNADERLPALALSAAAVADWLSPIVGLSPWLPVTAIAALALVGGRRLPRLGLGLRVGAQVAGVLLVLDALRESLPLTGLAVVQPTLLALLFVAATVAALSGLANNLPASAAVAALLGPGAGPYAALLGLSAGALITPHGSVATIASLELAGSHTPARWLRTWLLPVTAAVAAGTALLWLGVP
jgi:arsenical pump membrane protein